MAKETKDMESEKIEFDKQTLVDGIAYIVSEAYALGRFDEDTTTFEHEIKKWINSKGAYDLTEYELREED